MKSSKFVLMTLLFAMGSLAENRFETLDAVRIAERRFKVNCDRARDSALGQALISREEHEFLRAKGAIPTLDADNIPFGYCVCDPEPASKNRFESFTPRREVSSEEQCEAERQAYLMSGRITKTEFDFLTQKAAVPNFDVANEPIGFSVCITPEQAEALGSHSSDRSHNLEE